MNEITKTERVTTKAEKTLSEQPCTNSLISFLKSVLIAYSLPVAMSGTADLKKTMGSFSPRRAHSLVEMTDS